jgi:hypothetical protein
MSLALLWLLSTPASATLPDVLDLFPSRPLAATGELMLIAGERFELAFHTGFEVNPVYLLGSTATGAAACPPQSAPDCLDIPGPVSFLAATRSDLDGFGSWTLDVPALPETVVQLQAVVLTLPPTDVIGVSAPLTIRILPPSDDADGDGVPNTWEVQLGLDALSSDTDGDGTSDGDELDTGTDPRQP